MRKQPIHCKDESARFYAAPLELKRSGDQGEISGYGSHFGTVDQHGDIVEPGAFTRSLADHHKSGTLPLMLWQHDPSRVIGKWEHLVEDEEGLRVRGRINRDTQDGREALALLKQGALSGLSIGFRIHTGGAALDKSGVRRLSSVDLWEVSIVSFPSNRQARIDGVKAIDSERDFQNFLRKSGFPKGAARKLASRGWSGLDNHDDNAVTDLVATIRGATADLKGLIR